MHSRLLAPTLLAVLAPLAPELAAAAAQDRGAAARPQGKDDGKNKAPPRPRFRPMPTPRHAVPHRGGARIVVDGVLQDWPDCPVVMLDDPRQLSGTAHMAWQGSPDLSARAFMLWDEKYLYFAAVVRDDWHRPLTEDAPRLLEIPPSDSLVLTFDPRRDTRAAGRDQGRAEDREFWLSDVHGQGRKVVLWDRFLGSARFAEGALGRVVHEHEERLTTYEARLPWAEILDRGDTASARAVLDLQIVINDYDEPTDPMPQTRIGWTFGTGPRIDPGLLGSIMLWPPDQKIETVPEFPPPPRIVEDALPGPKYWMELVENLEDHGPVPLTAGSGAPADVLGAVRTAKLEQLDRHIGQFPRVDFLEYHQRVHRKMDREVRGLLRAGLPYFWHHVLGELRRRVAPAPPEGHVRIFRLPLGGWLIRSRQANFAIDPAGFDIDRQLWDALDFVILTRPVELARRNDQLLLRLTAKQRTFATHIAFHLPRIALDKMPLVQIGKTYPPQGLKVRALGEVDEKGRVTQTAAYRIEWPNGVVVVASGRDLDPEAWPTGEDGRVDALLLSALHPRAKQLGHRVGARCTILDDAFECRSSPRPGSRVELAEAFALQNDLRPHTSLILAPGESYELAPPPDK